VTGASPPRILAIAGSDSSGGAGIQADIKTITMLGGYAMTAITAVTAQNTRGVQAVEVLPPELVAAQIDSCIADVGIDAVKIGMLGSARTADIVAEKIAALSVPIVFDPVMVATSGSSLADSATIGAFKRLMALATLATPNLPELEVLVGTGALVDDAIVAAAEELAAQYSTSVLAKGGHGAGDRIVDRLVPHGERYVSFDDPRIDTRHTHGTGCTLSSAIATLLGHGQSLEHAVRLARRFVREAIAEAPGFGAGNGPLGHQAVRIED
jgi:hydroxymethylpyrimidine/phosphomethylpyrimidine kinase